MKILYVDDESINLKLFEINFNRKYDVVTASDGFTGLIALEKNTDIAVIVSDMKMPNMNGVEFIKKAKEIYPEKKFFILTGFEITEEILHALETNLILRYFSKPFNFNEIDKVISEAVA